MTTTLSSWLINIILATNEYINETTYHNVCQMVAGKSVLRTEEQLSQFDSSILQRLAEELFLIIHFSKFEEFTNKAFGIKFNTPLIVVQYLRDRCAAFRID